MKHATAAIVLASIAAAALPVSRASAAPPAKGGVTCITARGDARYVPYGYNHVVVLTSACTYDVTCSVATDVNPQPTSADVAAGATVEVLTFMGSPSQTFTPKVTCTKK